jgi:hypothetical protein
MAPRKLTMFKGVPVSQRPSRVPTRASTDPGDDGERGAEAAELDEEHGIDEADGDEEDDEQIAKGVLLLLEESGEFDGAGGEGFVLGDFGADFLHGAAEVAALQPGGDGDVGAEIIAAELNLAGLLDDVGDLGELDDAAGGGVQRQGEEGVFNLYLRGIDEHAEVHHAVAFEHAGGGLAEQGGVDDAGDGAGGEAKALRLQMPHADGQRWGRCRRGRRRYPRCPALP